MHVDYHGSCTIDASLQRFFELSALDFVYMVESSVSNNN
jgi:aspartate 1-decarboxylase